MGPTVVDQYKKVQHNQASRAIALNNAPKIAAIAAKQFKHEFSFVKPNEEQLHHHDMAYLLRFMNHFIPTKDAKNVHGRYSIKDLLNLRGKLMSQELTKELRDATQVILEKEVKYHSFSPAGAKQEIEGMYNIKMTAIAQEVARQN